MNRDERLAAMLARRRTDEWRYDGTLYAASVSTDLPTNGSGSTKAKEGTKMKFTFEIEPDRLAAAEAVAFARTAALLATFEGSSDVFDQLGRTLRSVLRDAIGPKLTRLVIERMSVRPDDSVESHVEAVLGASLRPVAKPRTKVAGVKKAPAKKAAKTAKAA